MMRKSSCFSICLVVLLGILSSVSHAGLVSIQVMNMPNQMGSH